MKSCRILLFFLWQCQLLHANDSNNRLDQYIMSFILLYAFQEKMKMFAVVFLSVICAIGILAKKTKVEPLGTFIYKKDIEVGWTREVEQSGISSVMDCAQKCVESMPPCGGFTPPSANKCTLYIDVKDTGPTNSIWRRVD